MEDGVFLLDFNIHHLDHKQMQGYIGFSLGSSQLCVIAYHSPLSPQFGTLCVLPNSLPSIKTILNNKLNIFIFSNDESIGLKMISKCQVICLNPQHISHEDNDSDSVHQLSHSSSNSIMKVISMAEFEEPLLNSCGVQTKCGEIKGNIRLLCLQKLPSERKVTAISSAPSSTANIPPLPLQDILIRNNNDNDNADVDVPSFSHSPDEDSEGDSFDSMEKDSLLVTDNFNTQSSNLLQNSLKISTNMEVKITSRPHNSDVCSPIYPKNVKHSQRYNLSVTEPDELSHFIEVDESNQSQIPVDIKKLRNRTNNNNNNNLSQKDITSKDVNYKKKKPWSVGIHSESRPPDKTSISKKPHATAAKKGENILSNKKLELSQNIIMQPSPQNRNVSLRYNRSNNNNNSSHEEKSVLSKLNGRYSFASSSSSSSATKKMATSSHPTSRSQSHQSKRVHRNSSSATMESSHILSSSAISSHAPVMMKSIVMRQNKLIPGVGMGKCQPLKAYTTDYGLINYETDDNNIEIHKASAMSPVDDGEVGGRSHINNIFKYSTNVENYLLPDNDVTLKQDSVLIYFES